MYSGLAMYMLRPLTSRGIPAFGCALSLRRVLGAIFSIASRMIWGPTEHLSPMTSAPNASSACAEQIILGNLARKLGGRAIDLGYLCRQPVLLELEAVCTEAVRLQNFGACFFVSLVNVAHQIRGAQVQFVIALVDEDALVVEHRPHRTVEDDDLLRVEQARDQWILRQRRPPLRAKRSHSCPARRSTSPRGGE